MADYKEASHGSSSALEEEGKSKTIYTARAASLSLASKEIQNPWHVQRGYGTEQEFKDGKLVFTDLELVNGPEAAMLKAQELAGEDDMVLGL